MTNYDKLKNVLKELFQLDQAELDFGIYRILNQKRDEIEQFLEKDLLPQVKKSFEHYQDDDKGAVKKELDKAIEAARQLGINPDDSPKVQELRDKLVSSTDFTVLENEIFSHLASFLKRYYDKGDFISMRRYKKDVYAIPYEGEEVKLHWANADQYYTKTTEYFRNYSFRLSGDLKVNFVIIDAQTEQNNNKAAEGKENRFAIHAEDPIEVNGQELNLNFTYQFNPESQEKLNQEALEILKTKIPAGFSEVFSPRPTEKNKSRTLLEKHLKDYTARNTFDYFIHKDLGAFLRRELDFYIKNEVLFIDDINTANTDDFVKQLDKIKAIKEIAKKIIDFLEQLENFQKKLWLKKKFVIETNYCITLDHVPKALYPAIISNKEQIEEWKRLFAIQEIKAPEKAEVIQQTLQLGVIPDPAPDYKTVSYSEPLAIEFLKANPYLVLDTAFFDIGFKNTLLASFQNLDENTDGLLIHSDNFQALNFLRSKYKGRIKGIYIDPPYNTDASAILYKNDYKDASFLSLMENRVSLTKFLMPSNGIICVAIDDEEAARLKLILQEYFDKEIGTAAIRSNPAGRKTKGKLAPAHEYALFYGISEDSIPGSLDISEQRLARYPKTDDKGRFAWANFIRSGNNDKREDRPKLYYPIFVNIISQTLRIPKLNWDSKRNEYVVLEKPNESERVIYPIVKQGEKIIEKNWQRGHIRVPEELEEYRVRIISENEISIDFKTRMDEDSLPTTWWDKNEYASANYGAAELKEMFGEKSFDFAKSCKLVEDCLKALNVNCENDIILDYFAGSGTSGHAVLNLYRTDKCKRKFILVEMGNYFDSVTKPRIQKAVYSIDWKDGKPVSREGISHCFKYIRLESYEDSLNNLILQRSNDQQKALDFSQAFKEEYMLGYMLDIETRESASLLNIDLFQDPFNYKLNITRNNETKETLVDLVETFNFLIGLKVKTFDIINGYQVITGYNSQGEKTLVIWRNLKEKTNSELDKFFLKQQYNTRDAEFDRIYVNGDNNLENLKIPDDRWKVVMIEEEFKKRMFEMVEY